MVVWGVVWEMVDVNWDWLIDSRIIVNLIDDVIFCFIKYIELVFWNCFRKGVYLVFVYDLKWILDECFKVFWYGC